MDKLANGKYLVDVRSDYRDAVSQLNAKPDGKDSLFVKWLQEYLDRIPYHVRHEEFKRQGLRGSWPDNSAMEPPYKLIGEEISIPERLIERLRKEDDFNDQDLEKSINAAIRLGLTAEGVEGIKP
jgi:hypothetical protein